MKNKITNIGELTEEIKRLKIQKNEQQDFLLNQYGLLRNKVEAPARIFNMVVSNIPGLSSVRGLISGFSSMGNSNSKADWLTRTLQLVLPLVLNKTLLKKSGWLKKMMVMLASETAVSQVNQDKISSVIGSLTNFIKPKKKKKKVANPEKELQSNATAVNYPPMITAEESVQDNIYGIPKDSEAY